MSLDSFLCASKTELKEAIRWLREAQVRAADGSTDEAADAIHLARTWARQACPKIDEYLKDCRAASRAPVCYVGLAGKRESYASAHEAVLAIAERAYISEQIDRVRDWAQVEIPWSLIEAQIRCEREKVCVEWPLNKRTIEVVDGSGDVPLLEQVLAVLTPQQQRIMQYLWDKKTASYDALNSVPGAWQDIPSDEAITKKLKDIRARLDANNLSVVAMTISVASRRVNLVRPAD